VVDATVFRVCLPGSVTASPVRRPESTVSSSSTLLQQRREPRAARSRDPWFDNAKMLLVTLVVVGHSWTMLPQTFTTTWAYNFLYLWHVPAFVMVTGYLSRSFTLSRRHLSRLVTTVVVPYLLFEYTLTSVRAGLGGWHYERLFVNPHWPMWYLTALVLWRLSTPLLRRLPHALPVAVVVSLVGGAFTGDALDLARTAGLLPFFVVGLLATPEHLRALRRPPARVTAVGVLALGLAVATVVEHHVGTEWLLWRSSYAELHVSLVTGVVHRLVLLAGAAALAEAFLCLVPGRDGWFSRLGPATMVVYLFHGFAVTLVAASAFPVWADGHAMLALVLSTVGAVGVALLLASPPVARRLDRVVDPVGSWRRRRRHSYAPAARGIHVGETELTGTLSASRASSGLGA
jgi:fucose 4-O-acetylase-like acetyltransferase